MLRIRTLPVGQLQTNCYLVIDEEKCAIVDAGDDADFITRIISDESLSPTAIIATHGHFDHILAVTELKLAYKVPFLMHAKDEFLLKRMVSSAKHFTGITALPPAKVDKYLKDRQKLEISNSTLEILHTPGHTPGSICIYGKREKILLSGDLVFANGVGRTDFAYANRQDLEKSIAKVTRLPDDTKVYPGHGEELKISRIRNFLKN